MRRQAHATPRRGTRRNTMEVKVPWLAPALAGSEFMMEMQLCLEAKLGPAAPSGAVPGYASCAARRVTQADCARRAP